MIYTVYSDGAARGNPGPAGAGFAVYDSHKKLIYSKVIPLGHTTNNVAEYIAFLEAAKYVLSLKPEKVEFLLDSELVVKQVAGVYKVKAPHLRPIYEELCSVLKQMNFVCRHVPRAENKIADSLANQGADQVK